jgi:hypothetical protein
MDAFRDGRINKIPEICYLSRLSVTVNMQFAPLMPGVLPIRKIGKTIDKIGYQKHG